MSDPPADPFGERLHSAHRWRCRLLGADFVFETGDAAAMRLLRQAFAGLPRHRLGRSVPTLHVRIVVRRRRGRRAAAAPPAPRFAAGAGIITAVVDADNHAVLAPEQGSALLVLSRDMLDRPYHARYELLEFTVITLAIRNQGLVPLHAACVSLGALGVLLLGDSGSGKSTLTLHAAANGLALVSEDSLFVHPRRLLAAALPNYLYLRSGAARRLWPRGLTDWLARAPTIRRRSGVRKRELDLRRTGLSVAGRAPRLVASVLLSAKPARSGRLLKRQSIRHGAAKLRALQAYAASRPEWDSFARRMARLPFFEMRRGAPAQAIAELQGLLRRQPRR